MCISLAHRTKINLQNCYSRFCSVMRQWRMLWMLKRSGRLDMVDMAPGELVVHCRACPKPGYNLSGDWKSDPLSWVAGSSPCFHHRWIWSLGSQDQPLITGDHGPLAGDHELTMIIWPGITIWPWSFSLGSSLTSVPHDPHGPHHLEFW